MLYLLGIWVAGLEKYHRFAGSELALAIATLPGEAQIPMPLRVGIPVPSSKFPVKT